jgi:hypothetical protein
MSSKPLCKKSLTQNRWVCQRSQCQRLQIETAVLLEIEYYTVRRAWIDFM